MSFWVCLHLKVEREIFASVSQSLKLTDGLFQKERHLWLRKTANTWPSPPKVRPARARESTEYAPLFRLETPKDWAESRVSSAALGVLDIRHCSHGIDVRLKRQFAHRHSRLNLQDQTIIVKKKENSVILTHVLKTLTIDYRWLFFPKWKKVQHLSCLTEQLTEKLKHSSRWRKIMSILENFYEKGRTYLDFLNRHAIQIQNKDP